MLRPMITHTQIHAVNSFTSLLEITHKSLLGDLCFFFFFLSLCLFLLCPCTQSLSSPLAVCILLTSQKQEGNLRRTSFLSVHRAHHHTRTLRVSRAALTLWSELHLSLLITDWGRQVCHSGHMKLYCQETAVFEQSVCRVTRLALQFSTGSCHSPPCLLDLGKSETQPRKKHSSKA